MVWCSNCKDNIVASKNAVKCPTCNSDKIKPSIHSEDYRFRDSMTEPDPHEHDGPDPRDDDRQEPSAPAKVKVSFTCKHCKNTLKTSNIQKLDRHLAKHGDKVKEGDLMTDHFTSPLKEEELQEWKHKVRSRDRKRIKVRLENGKVVWRSVAAKAKTIGSDDETNDDEYSGHRVKAGKVEKSTKPANLKESSAKKLLKYMATKKKLAQMTDNRVKGHALTPLDFIYGGLN